MFSPKAAAWLDYSATAEALKQQVAFLVNLSECAVYRGVDDNAFSEARIAAIADLNTLLTKYVTARNAWEAVENSP